jgi:hypothetical protein
MYTLVFVADCLTSKGFLALCDPVFMRLKAELMYTLQYALLYVAYSKQKTATIAFYIYNSFSQSFQEIK